MEFGDRFKQHVAKATAKAASVAKTLQSLDEMAKEDEYIKSEGLNVKTRDDRIHEREERRKQKEMKKRQQEQQERQRRKQAEMKQQQQQQQRVNNSVPKAPPPAPVVAVPEPPSSSMMHHREDKREIKRQTPQKSNKVSSELPQQKNSNFHMHQSVAALMAPPPSNEENEENNDPILQRGNMRSGEKIHGKDDFKNISSYGDEHNDEEQVSPVKVKKKKDPNRFFADLDARLNKSQDEQDGTVDIELSAPPLAKRQDIEQKQHQQSQPQQQQPIQESTKNPTTPQNFLKSFTSSENKMDWLQTTLSPKLKSITQIISGDKSRTSHNDGNEELNPLTNDNARDQDDENDEENVRAVTSSALELGAEEAAELERLQRQMNGGSSSSSFGGICKTVDVYLILLGDMFKNRYVSYLVFPCLITLIAYFVIMRKVSDTMT